MPRFSVAVLLLLSAANVFAVPVSGRVIDAGSGRALADVGVSNGVDIVRTDVRGRYRLDAGSGDPVFVIKPPDCVVPTGKNGLPMFWQRVPASRFSRSRIDFRLDCRVRGQRDEPFNMLVFADPQVGSPKQVDYYRRDIVEPLLSGTGGLREPVSLGMTLGDIVNDKLELYPLMNAITARMRAPWLHVAGNHDLDFEVTGDAGSLRTFHQTYGPDTFAWEEGPLSIIVLDDVIYRPGDRPAYAGGFRDDQFVFLENYLSMLDKRRLVVLAMHIPVFAIDGGETFDADDRQRLFRLIERFPNRLLLTGHRHGQMHYFHDEEDGWRGETPLHEYSVGAICGGYWGGVKDASGIPDGMMADGTPNGFARMRVHPDGRYALRWHPARADDDTGIALHAPKVLRHGSYPGVYVHANVFMGQEGDRVEYRIDDADWQDMQWTLAPDPRVLAVNAADNAADRLRGFDRVPEAEPSPHLWRGRLRTDLPVGEHRIEVRAFDRWRGELRAVATYRLDPVAP